MYDGATVRVKFETPPNHGASCGKDQDATRRREALYWRKVAPAEGAGRSKVEISKDIDEDMDEGSLAEAGAAAYDAAIGAAEEDTCLALPKKTVGRWLHPW